jgi:hypothetical protein
MKDLFGSLLVIFGLMAMAGSAGDCDGKCMEYANTWSEMMMAVTIGLSMFGTGIFILFSSK